MLFVRSSVLRAQTLTISSVEMSFSSPITWLRGTALSWSPLLAMHPTEGLMLTREQ